MNYYIDFDNTLFDTKKLLDRMFNSIISSITQQKELNSEQLLEECKTIFNNNIFDLPIHFSNKYNLNMTPINNCLTNTILNGKDLIFSDSIPFLKKLKSQNHKLYILSYCKDSIYFQSLKIAGSQISNYFDACYITATPKYELDIIYENGIFIDDCPNDLLGLYSKNPKEIIRLRRQNTKYATQNLENVNINEYKTFSEIPIN